MNFTQKNSLYLCKKCQFSSRNKNDYARHLLTAKHQSVTLGDKTVTRAFCCETCGKKYSSRNGLWSHNKKCTKTQKTQEITPHDEMYEDMSDKDLIMMLLKQNNDLVNKVIELSSNSNMSNSMNINTNSHNKHFNVNVFLNETCKNAMNMKDFVNSLKIESEELENVGKLGYVEGISNIFIRGLKELDETERPMHCMDKKRETLYIKEDDEWNKDDKKDKVKTVIGQIAHKNFMKLIEWKEDNPAWENTETKKHAQYAEMVKQVFTGITPDDQNGINKIIKKVATEVYVDKTAVVL